MKTAHKVFTRREVESLIAAGDSIVIKHNAVLRLNRWREKHPGGFLVIEHMVGRDATDEITISHSPDVLRLMDRYRIGYIEGRWENFTPPIQGGTFRSKKTVSTHGSDDEGYQSWAELSEQSERDDSASDVTESIDMESPLAPEDYTTAQVQREIDLDLAKYPSLDAATQDNIAVKFQALHQRVQEEGFYDCRFSEYGKEMIRYVSLFALFAYTLYRGWYFVSACFLGLFWHQIMFTAHDAGHRGITHNFTKDMLIGIFIADVCCGLSIGWWKSSHNVHHLITNHPEHDPDIQNVPLFATCPSFFNSLKSSYYGSYFPWDAFAGYAVQVQHYTYYPVMLLARFNLYALSWFHLLFDRSNTKTNLNTYWTRPTEIAGIAFYTFWYFYLLCFRCIPDWQSRIVFVLVSHLVTGPLHVQITLSHWGTSTADLGPKESFAQRQLRTTMDVECPAWLDFIHGGLQFQAVHHLFPRVPRHNLRRLQALVKDFCNETGIEYLSHGFVDGNGKVLGRLREVGEQARMLGACQKYMAATGESGLH